MISEQRWMLALGALTHHLSGRSHVRLGGFASSWQNKIAAATDLLSNWNVRNAEQAKELLTFLATEGFRADPPKNQPDFAAPNLLALDAGLLTLATGWSFLAGHITEEEAWSFLARLAPEVRRTYLSFSDFGAAFLEGRALRNGSWDVDRERAYHELLALAESPWCTTPWSALDSKEDARAELIAVDLTAFFACPICKELSAVDVLMHELPCRGCGESFLPVHDAWMHAIAEPLDTIRRFPIGHVHRSNFSGRQYSGTSRWVRVQLSDDDARFGRNASDPKIREIHPEIVAIFGERETGTARHRAGASAFVVACTGCGAPIRPTGERRAIACTYCKKVEELADEVWRIVSPPPPAPRLRIVMATPRQSGRRKR